MARDAKPLSPAVEKSLTRGIEYLLAAQHQDGGWHSQTYGAMRAGAALTSLALYSLAHHPTRSSRPLRDAVQRGWRFLEKGVAKRGFVASPDGSLDFPTYGTAMLLDAARRLSLDLSKGLQTRLARFLIQAQLTETRKFDKKNVHYGGWDLMGASRVEGLTSGTNVSVSSFALEGLRGVDLAAAEKTRARARRWVMRCQNYPGDGGFTFTSDPVAAANKAQWTDQQGRRPRSYGTATCDGLRCMIYAGVSPQDPRVAAAVKWIESHPSLSSTPGFEKLPETGWGEGLRYYYFFTLSKCFPYLSKAVHPSRREKLFDTLLSLQRSDGGWKSASSRMREDDPLIATPFVIAALGA